jgi:predicted permease
MKGVLARLRSIAGAKSSEARMEEEFAFHLEMEAQRRVAHDGLSESEARRRARVAFGGLDSQREAMRDGRGARWFADLWSDVRYGLRAMRRAPGFAIAVAITLGLGVGVNGMVFGYIDGLLFRPVPARAPEQLVAMFNVDTKSKQPDQMGYEDFLDFRDKSGVFDGLAGMSGVPLNLVVPWRAAAADMVWGEMVTENFFTVLGMRPTIGRLFTVDDGPQGQNPLAVLSYDGWQARFAGDPDIVGKTVRINGTGFTIVGVAPRGFKGMRTFGFWPELWVPIGMHNVVQPGSTRLFQGRGGGWMMVVGRMRAGMNRERTAVAAAQYATRLAQAFPATNATTSVIVLPAEVGFDNPAFVKPKMLVLISALGIFASLVTLVIICANLANLQLARAAARVDEIAIRLSLGCSRARLARQMLVESAVLALPGVLLAAAVIWAGPLVEAQMLPALQFRVGIGATADARVIAWTALVALVAITLFGLVPALRATSVKSLSGLIGARRTSTGSRRRIRSALVVCQLSLSVVLLVGATLFVRSLLVARSVDLGFDPRNRVLLSLNIGLQNYDQARGRRFYDDVLARLREQPGVADAAFAFPVPFDTYGRTTAIYVEGVATNRRDKLIGVTTTVASEGFVNALGLRLEAGREFTIRDDTTATHAMVVSRRLATQLWPGKEPIGQRARLGAVDGKEMIVVGVVGDAKFENIGPGSEARLYVSLRQRYRDWQSLVIHTRGEPAAMLPSLRAVISSIDPSLPVFGATTMDRSVTSGFSTSRSAAGIAGFFGVLALLISSVGLYAVVASSVAERTRELGVRVALGATPREVMQFVMRGGGKLGAIGLVIGLAGAIVVARLMSSLLYGLSPTDPITFASIPVALAVVVLLATYIPARRAVKLDPIAALRSD